MCIVTMSLLCHNVIVNMHDVPPSRLTRVVSHLENPFHICCDRTKTCVLMCVLTAVLLQDVAEIHYLHIKMPSGPRL